MKIIDLPHVDDVAMFRSMPFHPVTKEPFTKSERLDCNMESKYGTGMILCKERRSTSRIATIVASTIVIVVLSVLFFSIQVEVRHLDDFPLVTSLLSNIHVLFIVAMTIIVIVIAILKKHR